MRSDSAARGALGIVFTPEGKEATPDVFYFWVHDTETIVEKTQMIVTSVQYPSGEAVKFYGVIDDVARVGMSKGLHEDRLRFTLGASDYPVEGTMYAKVNVLAREPEMFSPPMEGTAVFPASAQDAQYAYGFDRVSSGAPVGLLRNGASSTLGAAVIDLDYLLGANGAHLNINGVPGVATKTSTMLTIIKSVSDSIAREREARPSGEHLSVSTILFSVKGTDMLWIDRPSKSFAAKPEYAERWHEMGVEPRPFEDVQILVPAIDDNPKMPQQVVNRTDLIAYSWSLSDVIEAGLLPYLFSAEDKQNVNFAHVLNTFEDRLTGWNGRRRVLKPRDAGLTWNPDSGTPQTFEELVEFLATEIAERDKKDDYTSRMDSAHIATVRSFYRRLRKLEREASGAFAWKKEKGQPPKVTGGAHGSVFVIDIASLARSSDVQGFVIAAVMAALKEERTSRGATTGRRYFVGLDEMNKWAPREAGNAITALFENIAAEMRSIGICLLSAQQFASKVSLKVVENSSCRMVGRTGPGELSDSLWGFLSGADKRLVSNLRPGEQLLMMPTFSRPAHIVTPYPCFAMKAEDVLSDGAAEVVADPATGGARAVLRRSPAAQPLL